MISIADITKTYGDTTVVSGVSLDLPESGITTIVGSNGAGKSTLLSLIARLLGADAGTVSLNGVDVHRAPSKAIARELAILRQDPQLTARITVRELVEFGRYPHSGGRTTDADRDAVDAALDYCDLPALAARPIHQLSGGQRQRAYIAMVLAQDTRYVLLDEPLNNLDMAHATGTMQLLRRLADERDKSVIAVLHDINYASVYSDRIVGMRDGAVVADGPPAAIVTPATMHAIFGIDIAVETHHGSPIAHYYRPRTETTR